ncbi:MULTISPECIES: hypothetical protein [unclassified Bradyrhizobium]|uniref:hypothetical protein n=1 Tax=unclassified Bradyrhizobium TaxID=2631580 RepID=UPI002305D1BF|nr:MULTISPECIES: hypothetical protein [unclassified Bradyrhizobium]MDA9451174.1 hypothetical protein [Bradyrhizobium sp. CCBAU 21360]MDA9457553.1 hypothetical protein [Bradyrhizobium sp. CCBAU 21359]
MKGASDGGSTVGATDDDAAGHMADALTYLSRVAVEAGYVTIAHDILIIREKLRLIAIAEKHRP